jgi:pyruvyltransferase
MRHLVPGAARKTHKYGLIPHYVDKDDQWVREQKRIFGESAVIINIEGGILDVIEQISSCQFIFSSTLHGLICADTYGVPNARLVLSNNIIGGDFKFKDYRLGVGAAPHQPVRPHATQPRLDELVQLCTIADVSYATQSLMGSYPFNDKAENFPSSST